MDGGGVTLDSYFWVLARVAGLSCFAALSISILTGMALRSAILDWLANNRAIRATHEFTSVLWIPLGLLHVLTLLLDQTARLTPLDVVVPFQAAYSWNGVLAIGLGTISLDLIMLVAITGWLKRRMDVTLWQWIHRLSYPAYGLIFLHGVLGGTDFSQPLVSALAWGSASVLAILALSRILWGRLPA